MQVQNNPQIPNTVPNFKAIKSVKHQGLYKKHPKLAQNLVDTFKTNKIPEEKILQAIYDNFKLQPAQIIEKLQLDKPQFRPLASYGHFGRNDVEVKWEELDKVEVLKTYL